MPTNRRALLASLLLILSATHTKSNADELSLEQGKLKAEQICANCHGLEGMSASGGNSALSPILTAQSKPYLVSKLEAYRDGTLQHMQMTFIAQMLSLEDIKSVATWYANIAYRLGSLKAEDEAPAIVQTCIGCHGLDGQPVLSHSAEPMPSLSAQPADYLKFKLKAYRAGRFDHATMTAIAATLSDSQIDHAADWYASIPLALETADQSTDQSVSSPSPSPSPSPSQTDTNIAVEQSVTLPRLKRLQQ